jgi:hypothetical protein
VNRFTLSGRGAAQYTILALAVLAPLLSLYALVLCVRTKMRRTKWLWLVLVLMGIGKIVVNWTTGQVFFTPIAFQLPPAGANAVLYGPWQVYVSLPVGAIVFLALRSKLAVPAQHEEARSATVTLYVGWRRFESQRPITARPWVSALFALRWRCARPTAVMY